MKKAKINSNNKKNKKEVVQNEEITVKKVVVVLVAILVIFVGFYFLTDYLISMRTETVQPSEENTTMNEIAFNNLLKQKDKSYYVLAVLPTDENADKFDIYTKQLNPIYTIDMNDSFNKSHIGSETRIGETVKDIIISDTTLFVIKDGKIEEHYSGYDKIKEFVVSTFSPSEEDDEK